MIPLQCTNCHAPLGEDDAFCGLCGTRAGQSPTQVDTTQAAPPHMALPPQMAPARGRTGYFGHPPAHQPTGPAATLADPTRYLCAAAYLDTTFANTVIGELVASHRAVAPSLDIDLVPIIRHCLNARKMQLTRDALLTVFLLSGLYLATLPTILILVVAFGFSMLPRVRWTRRSMGGAFLVGAAVVFALTLILALVFVFKFFNQAGSRSMPNLGPTATGTVVILVTAVVLVVLAATLLIFNYSAFQTLVERLRPGVPAGTFPPAAPRAEARISDVDSAQRGNLTLYAGENPFIGTGIRSRVWSIAIELDRAKGASDPSRWLRPEPAGSVAIDPVELHQAIRERLLKLNDPDLPENERIAALGVHDHLVGEGRRRWEEPLIDPVLRSPYSQAGQPAIDALIRHPQAGLRYYQRVSVTDEGQAVQAGGQEIISRSDQEITVSAFVYVAVEGRMFYLEFVSATLPPIHQRYHIIDFLPNITSGQFVAKVLLHTAGRAFADVLRAPLGVLSTLWQMWREHRSFRHEAAAANDYIFGDVGARTSIRELGAARSAHTYIQQLDAAKYTRIIERLIADTVLDFLTAKGVDTTAYQNSALAVINSGVMISGGTISAPVAAGPNSVASTHITPPATTTAH